MVIDVGTIKNEYCSLVPLDFSHTNIIVEWRNDPENSVWFNSQATFDAVNHEAWLSSALKNPNEMNWIILDNDQRPVGAASLYKIERNQGNAEFGRLLIGTRSDRGRGYAFQAIMLILSVSEKIGLSKIYLEVKKDNIAARTLYQKIGFQERSNDGQLCKMELLMGESTLRNKANPV